MMGVPDVGLKPVDVTHTAIAHGRNAVSEKAAFRRCRTHGFWPNS
jgi:hypothetical protein